MLLHNNSCLGLVNRKPLFIRGFFTYHTMNTEEKTLLNKTAEAVLEKATTIEVDILHPSLWQRLKREKKKTFVIKPASLATLTNISQQFLDVEVDLSDRTNILKLVQQLAIKESYRLAKIIAYAIHNSRDEPSKELIDFVYYNFEVAELQKVVAIVMEKINYGSFLNSIVSIKGMNVLEMSTASAKNAGQKETSLNSQRS
jgi:hypothetical protein